MAKSKESEDAEKYGGGKIGHRSWLKHMDKLTFNEPIYAALWKNDHDEITELIAPPEWGPDWKIDAKKAEWKLAQAFGTKWFPLKFGSTDKGKQKSFASVFEYHITSKRGEWFEIVLETLKDNAWADVNDLTYCKIEDAREVVEKLQVGGAKLSPSLMINALMNCSFLVVPSGTKIEEMEITEQDIKREFRNTDDPKDWKRGLEEFRRRLIHIYEKNGTEYDKDETVDYDKLAERMVEKVPKM